MNSSAGGMRETMAGKKVLVTGAAGRIGGIVLRTLGSRYELSALDRSEVEGVPSLAADLADLDAISPAFEGQDAVVHLGAEPSGGNTCTWRAMTSPAASRQACGTSPTKTSTSSACSTAARSSRQRRATTCSSPRPRWRWSSPLPAAPPRPPGRSGARPRRARPARLRHLPRVPVDRLPPERRFRGNSTDRPLGRPRLLRHETRRLDPHQPTLAGEEKGAALQGLQQTIPLGLGRVGTSMSA